MGLGVRGRGRGELVGAGGRAVGRPPGPAPRPRCDPGPAGSLATAGIVGTLAAMRPGCGRQTHCVRPRQPRSNSYSKPGRSSCGCLAATSPTAAATSPRCCGTCGSRRSRGSSASTSRCVGGWGGVGGWQTTARADLIRAAPQRRPVGPRAPPPRPTLQPRAPPAPAPRRPPRRQDPDFKPVAARILEDFKSWVGSGAGGDGAYSLDPVNHEGWRVAVDEGGGNAGWALLRASLHDPLLVLNVESDVKGGEDARGAEWGAAGAQEAGDPWGLRAGACAGALQADPRVRAASRSPPQAWPRSRATSFPASSPATRPRSTSAR
jgi:hypothetical protein